MRRRKARALCTLALVCTLACASQDDSGTPLDADGEGVLDPESESPAGLAMDAAKAEELERSDASLDARVEPHEDAEGDSEPPVSLPRDAGADSRDASLDASLRDSGALSDASSAADAQVKPVDASLPAHLDAGEDAGSSAPLDAGLDAAPPMDAALFDAGEAGAMDASPAADASTSRDAANEPERATFTRIYTLLRQRCRSCHLPGATYSLDFSTKQIAYDELVGGPNMGAAEFIVCSGFGYRRVIPGNADASLLLQKLEANQPCGDRMPPGALPDLVLSGEVRRWIEAGALND